MMTQPLAAPKPPPLPPVRLLMTMSLLLLLQ
jgi:hypothetical protein